VIKTWDQVRTPRRLAEIYLQPRIEALTRKINRAVANLITTANFGTYSLISGAGADVFDRADITGALRNLADAGVPVEDTANMFFITNPTAYFNMLAATQWTSEAVVGKEQAVAAQGTTGQAALRLVYGGNVRYDQHFAVFNSGKMPGIAMHRYAIAGIFINPPATPSDVGSVKETTIFPKPNVPVQVQMEYSLKEQGVLVNVHSMFGVKVARSEYGSLVETA
jgi:hypothetical protein